MQILTLAVINALLSFSDEDSSLWWLQSLRTKRILESWG